MLVRTFTLRFDSRIDGFDDEGLRAFMSDKDVKSVRDHFFLKDETPYWAFAVSYDVPPNNGCPAPGKKADNPKPDYRSILQEEHWPLFNVLRDWRAEKAKAEGIPPYLVFTNAELAQVTVRAPATLSALGEIHGIGTAKIKRFGREVLAILAKVSASTPDECNTVEPVSNEEKDAG